MWLRCDSYGSKLSRLLYSTSQPLILTPISMKTNGNGIILVLILSWTCPDPSRTENVNNKVLTITIEKLRRISIPLFRLPLPLS